MPWRPGEHGRGGRTRQGKVDRRWREEEEAVQHLEPYSWNRGDQGGARPRRRSQRDGQEWNCLRGERGIHWRVKR